ncbi:MAG: hypothetical protein BYD32DRAFT_427684 [Podila humilis]|nr:MAG: hypothetical protein BYD32DRAFT_427684 [Podila humilis]
MLSFLMSNSLSLSLSLFHYLSIYLSSRIVSINLWSHVFVLSFANLLFCVDLLIYFFRVLTLLLAAKH